MPASWPPDATTERSMFGTQAPDENSKFSRITNPRSCQWPIAPTACGWLPGDRIKIWDADTGRLNEDVAHPGRVSAGAWSPDDKLLACGHSDGTVTISGAHTGDKIVTLRGHFDAVYHLAWSPDSARLASTGGDFIARIWEVGSEKTVLDPIREKGLSDSWTTFNTLSSLGGSLLGQKKYADAEPLLLKGYQGMKERKETIPPVGQDRLPEAVERLVQLYEATGKKDEAAKWQTELLSLRQPAKPEKKP